MESSPGADAVSKTSPYPWRRVVFLLLLIAAMAGGGAAWWLNRYFTYPGPLEEEVTIILPRGMGFMDITRILEEKRIVAYPRAFQAMVAYYGRQAAFKAGEYRFSPSVSPRGVMEILVKGKVVLHPVTLPEGLTVREIMRLLEAEDKLSGEIETLPDEGMLLPETYHFTRGEARDRVLKRMEAAMRKTLEESWASRSEGLPFATKEEALTLASIVEKETGLAEERGRVAAVYINRLKKGMKLQADPTIVYAITEGGREPMRPIRKSDLEHEQPYNTYMIAGLPPGPIACPGKAALEAVLHPPQTGDLYFVATGNGGHHFSATHKEHMANVAKYRAEMKKK